MIQNYENTLEAAEGHRTLAVVAGCRERAGEVRAQFAALGENVETIWYANPRDLLAGKNAFSAVIIFSERDASATDAAEAFLRRRLAHTPLFRVAA
ncbi:MAG: hypothetical protein MUE42_05240, partial [Opitutaceae bacterium]|jgi:hypothetical protein|nr:hypothetical protein [Opitutaceae bacterium]